jgi:hypothetical protein
MHRNFGSCAGHCPLANQTAPTSRATVNHLVMEGLLATLVLTRWNSRLLPGLLRMSMQGGPQLRRLRLTAATGSQRHADEQSDRQPPAHGILLEASAHWSAFMVAGKAHNLMV